MLLEKKMQNFDSKYYQQIFEPIEKDKPFDYKLETGNTQKKKHDFGHDQKTPKSENKGQKALQSLINMEYSGISGIKRLKSKQ